MPQTRARNIVDDADAVTDFCMRVRVRVTGFVGIIITGLCNNADVM